MKKASTTTTGSLIWNTGDDKWTAGPKGSEDDVVLNRNTNFNKQNNKWFSISR